MNDPRNDMNTGSEFDATRHLAFAKDRLVAVYESASAPSQGKQSMAEYTLVALDLKDGSVRDEKKFIGKWGAIPSLYSTLAGAVMEVEGNLVQLEPDLTETGRRFEIKRGRVTQLSPDGSTMAWETTPGITLLDAKTLSPTNVRLDASIAGSLSTNAVLNNNKSMPSVYPKDTAYVWVTDTNGERLLFHGTCGGPPSFITNEIIFIAGCGQLRLLDLEGHLIHEANVPGNGRLAGVSQNGKRFAIVASATMGDPSVVLFEHFILFDTDTGQPIAMVRSADMPANQSWSAFSPDGVLFATGGPGQLNLYRVP
jgi:hypothetical protein